MPDQLSRIKLVMNESQLACRKHSSQHRKHSLSEKTRSDYNPAPSSPQDFCPLMARPIKTLGRKYVQEHLFKVEQRHHEIVISDEVVRNSKLFRMLRDKIEVRDALFAKEYKQLSGTREQLTRDISQINHKNHSSKLNLWQLKNQILELKAVLVDQEEEARRLEYELNNPQEPLYAQQGQQAQQEQAEQEMPESDNRVSSQEFQQNEQNNEENKKEEWLQLGPGQRQEQKDIKAIITHLHRKVGLNPEHERHSAGKLKQEQQE